MGPVFIKFAQSISTRTDILDKDLATEILRVCDRMKPPLFKHTKNIIESEFKLPIHLVFESIDEDSIASASIATVYRAKSIQGELLAVKVLKPNVEKIFIRDIKILFFFARIASIFGNKRIKFVQIVERFANATMFELDLRFEAANAANLKKNLEDDVGIYIPKIFWKRTSKRVLSSEYIIGTPFTKFTEQRSDIAKILIISFFKQVYRDGFFHADLHPGNLILTDKNSNIAFVDFGIMGRISDDNKEYILEVVNALLCRDYESLAEAHFKRNYVHRNQQNFSTACRALGEPLLEKSLSEIFISEILEQILKIISDFNLEINVELLLLKKNLLFLEGNCLKLDPNINMWDIIRPFIKNWYKEHYSAKNLLKYHAQRFCSTMSILENCIKNGITCTSSSINRPSVLNAILYSITIVNFFGFLFILMKILS